MLSHAAVLLMIVFVQLGQPQQITTFQALMHPATGPRATTLPPDKVWINPSYKGDALRDQDIWHIYQLNAKDFDNGQDDGLTLCNRREIILRAEQTEAEMRDSLIHELLHGITRCDAKHMNSTGEDKHQGIYWLSPRLAWMLTHNPALLKYLSGQSLEKKEAK